MHDTHAHTHTHTLAGLWVEGRVHHGSRGGGGAGRQVVGGHMMRGRGAAGVVAALRGGRGLIDGRGPGEVEDVRRRRVCWCEVTAVRRGVRGEQWWWVVWGGGGVRRERLGGGGGGGGWGARWRRGRELTREEAVARPRAWSLGENNARLSRQN